MTFPTQTTLNNLSLPNRETGWFHPNDNKSDQFIQKLPKIGVEFATDAFEYNQADSIPSVTFLAKDATKLLPTTNVTQIRNIYQRIGEHCELDTYDYISGRDVFQMDVQIRGIKLGIIRELSKQLIQGTATPNILGLASKAPQGGSNTIGAANGAANGGFMSLQDLYSLKYFVQDTRDSIGVGQANYFVSNEKTVREVMGLLDQAGRSPDWVWDDELQTHILEFAGVKWLISDSVPNNETKGTGTNLTSVYAVQLGGPTGIYLSYAKSQEVECDEWGIMVNSIPIQETKDKRLSSIEAFYTFVCPEDFSVSRLDGIDNTQFAQ